MGETKNPLDPITFDPNCTSFQRDIQVAWKLPIPFFSVDVLLGGGFKYFLFSPLVGEDAHFD